MIAEAAAAVSLAVHRAEHVGPRLLVGRRGAVLSVDPRGGASRLLVAGSEDAAWSPDGTLLAFVRGGDLWLANADGSGQRRLTTTPHVVESGPSWAAGGGVIAYTALEAGRRRVRLLTLPFGLTRPIARGGETWSPAFTRDGTRLAFVSEDHGVAQIYVARADGSHAVPFHAVADPAPPADIRDLAWSPNGRTLAYTAQLADGSTEIDVDNGSTRAAVGASLATDNSHPEWSPDGRRLAFSSLASDGTREVVIAAAAGGFEVVSRGTGRPLDWRPVPLGRPLFPDLVQRPPSGLTITQQGGHFLLGFTSLVDNRGPGPLWIHGSRPKGVPRMTAVQRIELAGGGVRTVAGVGFLHYTVAPPHYHWHLLHYDRYELRSFSDFDVVVRDHKSGFCLADHYGITPGMTPGPPRFLGTCGQFEPWLRSVDEGTSVAYTDRYPANFHGQNLDLSGVPAGRYWLVHRVNSDFGLRERRYDNDAASLLVRITWPYGHGSAPRVQRLRSCLAERC